MTEILIRFAESAEDIDRLFRARHHIFAEVDGYIPPRPDGRLCDRFDAYPTNRNLIAEHEGRIIGGLRFTENSPAGTPCDEFFDFSPFLDLTSTRFGSASKLFLEHEYRGSQIAFTLYGVAYAWCLARGWTHVDRDGQPGDGAGIDAVRVPATDRGAIPPAPPTPVRAADPRPERPCTASAPLCGDAPGGYGGREYATMSACNGLVRGADAWLLTRSPFARRRVERHRGPEALVPQEFQR